MGKTTHGLSNTRIYGIYRAMISRCYSANDISFKYYGGKGIEVCDEWKDSVESFVTWSLDNDYDEDLTIDRRKSDFGYSPDNCRWVNQHLQILNQERNKDRTKEEMCEDYTLERIEND